MAEQRLSQFLLNEVRPTSPEMSSLNQVVDQVVRFLHNFNQDCPGRDYRVSKVVKSGSLGKGTAVQNKMDVDLVMFMEAFSDMSTYRSELPNILQQLARYVQTHEKLKFVSQNRYMVKCQLKHDGKWHDVDILPAVDLLNTRSRHALYEEMGRQAGDARDGPQSYYSVCLAEMQRDFVKSKADGDSRIKDLIRLVKYWSKEQGLATVSYCLELTCIKVYQEFGASYPVFSMPRLFKKVMEKLADIENLQVNFNDNYNGSSYNRRWSVPYVMDPANPYNNTLPPGYGDKRAVASAASSTLQGRPANGNFNFCTAV